MLHTAQMSQHWPQMVGGTIDGLLTCLLSVSPPPKRLQTPNSLSIFLSESAVLLWKCPPNRHGAESGAEARLKGGIQTMHSFLSQRHNWRGELRPLAHGCEVVCGWGGTARPEGLWRVSPPGGAINESRQPWAVLVILMP